MSRREQPLRIFEGKRSNITPGVSHAAGNVKFLRNPSLKEIREAVWQR